MKKLTIKEVEDMGSDNLNYFGGVFEGGIHLQQISDEIVPCMNDIMESGVEINNYLEIGSAAGGSLYLFNYAFNLKNMVIIDDNKHHKHIYRPWVIKNISGNVNEFIGNSTDESVVKSVKDLGLGFDIILIDGWHGFKEVVADIKNYAGLLNKGGFLILHDVETFGYINKIWRELKDNGQYKASKKYVTEVYQLNCGIGLLQRSET